MRQKRGMRQRKGLNMRVSTFILSSLWLWPAVLAAGEDVGSSGQKGLANPLAAQSLDSLTATVARPLFAPDRKLPAKPVAFVAPVAEEVKLPPPPVPNVSLVGILMERGGRRVLLRAGPSDKIARLQIGDVVGGWTIAAIDSRRMVLALQDQIAAVTMFQKWDVKPNYANESIREQERMERAANMHR